jgi:hypothetical protein
LVLVMAIGAAGARVDAAASSDRVLVGLWRLPPGPHGRRSIDRQPLGARQLVWKLARITAPVPVVGPARAMLVVVRGSARDVADALSEALRGPRSETRAAAGSPALPWPEWTRTTPAVASWLRDMAAAAEAFTDTYVSAVLQQSYSFDPDHDPVLPDELW